MHPNRSNGIVNVGFVMYHSMKTVATETILFVRSRTKAKKGQKEAKKGQENNGHPIAVEDPIAILWRIASGTLVPGMINVVLTVTPFAAFQGIGGRAGFNPENYLIYMRVLYLQSVTYHVAVNIDIFRGKSRKTNSTNRKTH